MTIDVVDIKDHEDGSATLTVDMDDATLKRLASIGLLKVISDAAKDIVDECQETTTPTVESLIEDTIKILQRQPHVGEDRSILVDALNEIIQDAINTLIVAKGFFDVNKD